MIFQRLFILILVLWSWHVLAQSGQALQPIPGTLQAGHGHAKFKESFGSYKIKDKANYRSQYDFEVDIEGATNRQRLNIRVTDTIINRLRFTLPADEDERYYGFGEQFTHLEMTGKKVPIWVQEQGIGRGDATVSFFTSLAGVKGSAFTTYAPMPVFITNKGRAFYLKTTAFAEVDLSRKGEITIEIWDNEVEVLAWQADEPLELIEELTAEVGRMPKLPDWAYGTWLGLQGGAEKVERIVDETLAYGNPVTAVWIQDWVGRRQVGLGSRLWWWWRADSTYGEFPAFCERMHNKGVKVLGYVNSFLAIETPMGAEAADKGYVIKDHEGNPYQLAVGGFDAYLVDLTNPEAFEWLKDIIKTNMIGVGLDGWMADFSEGPPPDAVLFSGVDAVDYHNQYTVDWVRLNNEAIEEAGKTGEVVFFNRSGYAGSTEYSTLFWAGDQMHSYKKNDGLRSAINGIVTGGMSGISLNHADIGGYTTVKPFLARSKRRRDLFYRWTEVATFMPVFRTHEGLRPEMNIQSYTDSSTQTFFARMGQMHQALQPYFEQLNIEAATKGWPVVRQPWLAYPEDEQLLEHPYQFLLGNNLLMIPVLKKKSTKAKGYLPPGNWQHVWTGETFTGGQKIQVRSEYGYPAVFINMGSADYEVLKAALETFR